MITDSKYVAQTLARLDEDPVSILKVKSHRAEWGGIVQARRHGIKLKPFWIPRNTNPLMSLVDAASRLARVTYPSDEFAELLSHTIKKCKQEFPLTRQAETQT